MLTHDEGIPRKSPSAERHRHATELETAQSQRNSALFVDNLRGLAYLRAIPRTFL
jgi:hypothetical protein